MQSGREVGSLPFVPARPAPAGAGTARAGRRDLSRRPALGVMLHVAAACSLLVVGVLGLVREVGLDGLLGALGRVLRGGLVDDGLLGGVGLGGVLGGALGLLHHGLLRGVLLGDQLDHGHRGVVALAGADLGDAGVATGTLRERRGDLLEQRVDDTLV